MNDYQTILAVWQQMPRDLRAMAVDGDPVRGVPAPTVAAFPGGPWPDTLEYVEFRAGPFKTVLGKYRDAVAIVAPSGMG